jgi:hypothetical protein
MTTAGSAICEAAGYGLGYVAGRWL